MAYSAKVLVVMFSEDATTKKPIIMGRKDMDFTVSVENPGEIVPKAKAAFDTKYGPDLVVRTCNLLGREAGILHFMPAGQQKTVVPLRKK